MAKRLTEKHPLTKKLRELESFMMDKGIAIEWNGYRMVLTDAETGKEAFIRDAESNDECDEVPWMCETKLVYEDDFDHCGDCDLPDACSDFGCAIKTSVREAPRW